MSNMPRMLCNGNGVLPYLQKGVKIKRTYKRPLLCFYEHSFSAPIVIFHVKTEFYFFFCKAVVYSKFSKMVMGNFSLQFANVELPIYHYKGLWAVLPTQTLTLATAM